MSVYPVHSVINDRQGRRPEGAGPHFGVACHRRLIMTGRVSGRPKDGNPSQSQGKWRGRAKVTTSGSWSRKMEG
jgi:hypothetical protein